jgi:hypothetical protein
MALKMGMDKTTEKGMLKGMLRKRSLFIEMPLKPVSFVAKCSVH